MKKVGKTTRPFNSTVIQVYAPTTNAKEAEIEQFYEDLRDLLELTAPKDVPFIMGDWNAKVGSQETSGVTGKFSLGVQNEANRATVLTREQLLTRLTVLSREPVGQPVGKHPFPITQEMTLHMDITRWSIPKSN